jgi:hypothetical protein
MFWEGSYWSAVALVLEDLARLAAIQGDTGRALRLGGAAAVLAERHGAVSPPTCEALLALCPSGHDAQPTTADRSAWAEGRAMPVHEAVAYALEEPITP